MNNPRILPLLGAFLKQCSFSPKSNIDLFLSSLVELLFYPINNNIYTLVIGIEMSQNNPQSLRDSLYLTDNIDETTFKYDNKLPNLPVPAVKESVSKLLDTIKPIATDPSLFEETKRKALEFLQDDNVAELQRILKERASSKKNWLEEWWLEFAYLRSRKPLIPYSNMVAPLPITNYWPVVNSNDPSFNGVRAKRTALSTYFQLSFWKILMEERMRPMIHKGVPWSMSQFRYLFNTVRIPGEPKDEILSWFTTSKDGRPKSTEIIVLHKGYIFAINPVTIFDQNIFDQNQVSILSAPQIEKQLKFIEDYCGKNPLGPGVGVLTTTERTEWAEAREKLSKISHNNEQILNRIDQALSVIVLDDFDPKNGDEILKQIMCGNPLDRWADKSITSIAFKNGAFGASADHTPYDGFCTGILTHYLLTSVEECNGIWNDNLLSGGRLAKYSDPELLKFDLSTQVSLLVNEARVHFVKVCSTIDTLHDTFNHFGKAILKEHRFHPEAFIQCAIHSAYYRQHKQMAPAYVTASTRRFYNGRTETCRSCYPEMFDFAKFMTENRSTKPRQAYDLLRKSTDKFQTLMNQASNGHGCDRHLLGLYLIAILEDKKMPELFDDELVRKTNNYVLSTSCSGYWNVCGGVPPLVEDGYGCFYGIEDDSITFCCTAYKPCPETNLKLFYSNLKETLVDMHKILLNSKM